MPLFVGLSTGLKGDITVFDLGLILKLFAEIFNFNHMFFFLSNFIFDLIIDQVLIRKLHLKGNRSTFIARWYRFI